MRPLTLRSPAKLNLYLKVIAKRPDGYHELKTVFERIDLSDDIRLSQEPSGRIRIVCDHPQVPKGPKNLVYKVAAMLKKDFGITQGVEIRIRKRIPVAAGLAGGSSNAATVLSGLNQFWQLGLDRKGLVEYACKVGSDVAFFLYDCPWGLGTGRGEVIRRLDLRAKLWHVLVVPKVRMLTPKVYGAMNLKLTKFGDDVSILTHYLRKNDVRGVGSVLCNDLEVPIAHLKPNLLKIKEKIASLDVAGVAFSGSGPSIFSVVQSKKKADEIASILKRRYKQVYVVSTL